ncbi:hypothetical protein THAOC_24231, partial [Thalassiosira oceanica]
MRKLSSKSEKYSGLKHVLQGDGWSKVEELLGHPIYHAPADDGQGDVLGEWESDATFNDNHSDENRTSGGDWEPSNDWWREGGGSKATKTNQTAYHASAEDGQGDVLGEWGSDAS